MDELQKLVLGDKITVRTVPGRGGKPIGRYEDGRVILFDQNSPYYDKLAPGQSVECSIIVISENYLIVDPIHEPEKTDIVHYQKDDFPELQVDDIVEDLEKLIEDVSGNAEIIPRALLSVIRLQQFTIKLLEMRRTG